MEQIIPPRGAGRAPRTSPAPASLTRLIAAGTLDTELAALAWLLVERRVPLVVATEAPTAGTTSFLHALFDFLPAGTDLREVDSAAEDFAWLPQARELGWSGPLPATGAAGAADPHRTVLLVHELGRPAAGPTAGSQARVLVRALQLGYGLAATVHAASLEEVFTALEAAPVSLSHDEIRRLGLVLVLRVRDGRQRVVAAHYLRPLERDGHGHLQRRPPAVLATWEPATDRFEHFAWGVTPELAARAGTEAPEFERRHAQRRAFLHRLVHGRVVDPDAVRRELRAYRDLPAADHPRGDP